jgi:formylglycine-generating enzyme required for sulfatase activity
LKFDVTVRGERIKRFLSIILPLSLFLTPCASDGAEKAPDMVFVKGGCFEMGCGSWTDDCNYDETKVHVVCVDDFYMGTHEVTVGEFREFVNDTGYRTDTELRGGCNYWSGSDWAKDITRYWDRPGFFQTDKHPVVCVSWNDTHEYIKWRSQRDGDQYRLPTEAEWEYAARSGGKGYRYSWGDGTPAGNIADESTKKEFPDWSIWKGYDDGYIYTAPVRNYDPNELGLHDLTGNVLEWCSDWYNEEYYSVSPKDNPRGPPKGQKHVLRGAAWNYKPKALRTSNRNKNYPDFNYIGLGFRLAR